MLESYEERAHRQRRDSWDLGPEPPQLPPVNPEGRGRTACDVLGDQERFRSIGERVSIGFFTRL
jgi:hypothetical protein